MEPLYPLKFKTIFKEKLWGGAKIKDILGKDFGELPNCGETWELSGVEGNISVVSEGNLAGKDLKSLISSYQHRLLGKSVYQKFGEEFPLLIKFIDANDDLSIQVHPDDILAKERHNSFGKTEMWYVLQADKGSSLISGFNQPLNQQEYLKAFEEGRLDEILNREEVEGDDVFFLPAGRVHTIGKGLLIAEIQQTSDITYRIYDFDRTDDQGNKRELHVEEALEAIDFQYYDNYKTDYQESADGVSGLVDCEYFTTKKYVIEQKTLIPASSSSFRIYIGLEGTGKLVSETISVSFGKGEVILVPAELSEVNIEPAGTLRFLETYISD